VSLAVDCTLAAAILAAWLGAIAFGRLATPLERVHAVTFINVVVGGAFVLAAFLSEGVTVRTLKCALIWLVMLPMGALLSHATGRALHLRDGERR